MTAPYLRIPVVGGGPWWSAFRAVDGTLPAIVIDANAGRAALPVGLAAGDVPGASLAQLTALREASIEECFAFSAASTTARWYVGSDGLWRNDRAADAIRYCWLNGKRQILLEDASTNLITQSATQTDAAWSKTNLGTLVANAAVAPTGTQIATLVPETSGSAARQLAKGSFSVTSGISYTYVVIVKYVGRAWIRMSLDSATFGASNVAWFNIQTGALGTVQGSTTASIRSLGSGWYACIYTRAATATAGSALYLGLADVDGATTYTGDGSSGIYLWNVDVKALPYWDMPVVTAGATVTRAIETARFSPLVEAILQRSAATIRVCGQGLLAVASGPRIVGIANPAALLARSSGNVQTYDGTTTLTDAGATVPWSSAWGVAMGFDAAGRSVSGGGTPATDANGPGTRSSAYLGRDSGAGPYAPARYDKVAIYPARVSDAALQAMARAA